MSIFVGQGMTISRYIQIFNSIYLIKFLRYGQKFLHVITTLIGFKITFSNIRSHGAPCLISPLGLKLQSQTLGLKGLIKI